MIKKFFAGLPFLLMLNVLMAQTGTITSSINATNPIFIKGATGFENILTVADAPANAQTVWLCAIDDNGEAIDSTAATFDGTDSWDATISMGELESSVESIEAHYYDDQNERIDVSEPYSLSVKEEPVSVTSGVVDINVDSIDENGIAFLEFTIHVPDSIKTIENFIVGVGGKSFGFEYNDIVLIREYDLNTGLIETTGSAAVYKYQLNAFGTEVQSDEISLDQFSGLSISIDAELNPIIEGHYNAVKNFFHYETHEATLPLPISPAKVSMGAGLDVAGGFAADCYLGIDQSSSEFGFIQKPGGERSNFSIGAKMEGEVRVTASLFSEHLVGIRAALRATGRIGASYEFQTVPVRQDSFLFGGDLRIDGNVQLTGLAGKAKKLWCGFTSIFSSCEPTNTVLEGMVWPRDNGGLAKSFGDGLPGNLDTLLSSHLTFNFHNNNSRSAGMDSDALFDIPDADPQPAFANRGASIAAAWIESDSANNRLLFSVLDTLQNRFSLPLQVGESEVMLSDPKVAIAPDGSAIIAWAQSKYQLSDISSATTVDSLVSALEVWYAVYDPVSASITSKSKVYNPIDLPASKPCIAISDSGKALIAWLSEDTSSNTDIWYAELVNGNGIWYQSSPGIINDLPGNNYDLNISFTDSVNAIAAWITDADGNDSTGGNQIMTSNYDGENWSNTSPLSDESDNTQYHELAMDFNGKYGAIAYTSTVFDDEDNQVNILKVEVYHEGQWDEVNYYEYSDSLKYVTAPRVSISDQEFAAVSYQTADIYSEDSKGDAGEISISLKDLNNGTDWDSIDFSTMIAEDTSIAVWGIDIVLGRNNKLYTLSQEQDTIVHAIYGGQYAPHTGVLFGNPAAGLVLRGLTINSNLTVEADSSTSLPETPTGLKDLAYTVHSTLQLLVYPNPTRDYTTIEYAIPASGIVQIEVYDLMGRNLAIPVNQFSDQGNFKTNLSTSALSAGVYIIKLSSNGQSKSCKLIVQ